MGEVVNSLLLLEGVRAVGVVPFPKLPLHPLLFFARSTLHAGEFQQHLLHHRFLKAGHLAGARVLTFQ